MRDFLTALALMFALEGLAFAAFPAAMRRALKDAAEMPERMLRIIGIVGAIIGVALVWASKGFPALTLF